MKKRNLYIKFFVLLLLSLVVQVQAQNNAYHSVLAEHSWYRLAVAHEGVYKIDRTSFVEMGIDAEGVNPDQIRVFGVPAGILPEKNSDPRPDDLEELAIFVEGAEDGRFDAEDYVLFYGQEPTCWKLNSSLTQKYERQRNYYSDTTYYYLCVDSGVNGLRIGEKASLPIEEASSVITEFLDVRWHEEELFSPFVSGRNWYGESLTSADSVLELTFDFPHLVKSKAAYLKAELLGRAYKSTLYYNLRVDNDLLANNVAIGSYGNNSYGLPSSVSKQLFLESDTANVQLQLRATASGQSLYLDFIELYAWRQLIREGGVFPFRLIPDQFEQESNAVWIQNVSPELQLWDVTTPLCPMRQQGRLTSGNLVFATDEHVEKRYVLFDVSAASSVNSWTRIDNQDLHSISYADMLIISTDICMGQAQALADFHAMEDGMDCQVVNVHQIYNEFSAGICDPTALRDFIRMVYHRSAGGLKYVTLFGKASMDFRNLNGYLSDFIPCYETQSMPYNVVRSFCTDDYFGLMEPHEGENSMGTVDIGIGRIPASTEKEAETVMRKIRHYNDINANQGIWKTAHLFVADDESTQYVNDNELYYRIEDTLCHPMTAKKIYAQGYGHVNTPAGVRIPEAHDELLRDLEKGALVMTYTGHGGVRGLTQDGLFTNSDIASLSNYDRMPFVFTATCEFAKYDDPTLNSAGEQMFLLPSGGAIALLTSSRPTVGNNNVRLGKALARKLFQREDGKPLRFGDICRLAKQDTDNFVGNNPNNECLNISFLLLGDPALRLAVPEEEVVALRLNGKDLQNEDVTLHAMSMVNMEGEVRTADGRCDADFNGELWVRLYDQKSRIKLEYQSTSGNVNVVNCYHHKDVLFQGYVSVNSGRFSVSFQVPSDITVSYGAPRFSFYAFDSIRGKDAMGVFDNLTMGGQDPSIIVDDEGPKIDFYWNNPSFKNGDVVERNGVLYADLYDAQGIYHYDYALGRDIVMRSNAPTCSNVVLNSYFKPVIDDFRRGSIAFPLEDLEPGSYQFELKAWDMQNNSSSANLWFVVGEDIYLAGVRNFPNPFNESTYITLKHYGEDGNFDVHLEVYDITGRLVDAFSQRVSCTNGQIEPIRWDGCNQGGSALPTGLYLYRLTLSGEDGYSRTVSQRMMIYR